MSGAKPPKRPVAVTSVITIHVLAVLGLVAIIVYLIWLTRSPEILRDKDAADAIHGLKIGALVLALPVAFWSPGIYGMWRRRLWGWWLTLITGAGIGSTFVYAMIDDGWNSLNAEDAATTAALVMLPLLLLLPRVRKHYRHPQGDPAAVIGTGQESPQTS